jgi:hypothetical protein
MWLAWRIDRGAMRAPGRFVTAPSQAMPASPNGRSDDARGAIGTLRKLWALRKAKSVMAGSGRGDGEVARQCAGSAAGCWRFHGTEDHFMMRKIIMVRRINFFHCEKTNFASWLMCCKLLISLRTKICLI